jgi:hypothetical protein
MLTFAKYKLEDSKLDSFLRCLFYRDLRWIPVPLETAQVVFTRISTLPHMGYHDTPNTLAEFRNRVIVVLDYQDWWTNDWIGDADIRNPKDFGYAAAIANGNRIVYLKLQINEPKFYASHQTESMVVLSCPLLLGGGRRWIGHPDTSNEFLFENRLTLPESPPQYDRDVAFINSIDSMPWRAAICDVLEAIPGRSVFCSRGKRNENSEKATIPIREMFNMHRRSRVTVSANGSGMWCLKDGELFNSGCFILREVHKNISINPLTPKFREHWDSFTLETLAEKVDYWLSHDIEREEIKCAGYDYFRRGILGAWATTYTDRLEQFITHSDPASFGDLLVGSA